VTFSGIDEVQGFHGDSGIKCYFLGFCHVGEVEKGVPLQFQVKLRFVPEHGVKALDGGDADPVQGGKSVGGEALHIMEFDEFPAIIHHPKVSRKGERC